MTDFNNRLTEISDEAAIDIVARTLWGEAHDDPVRGKEAVAAVLINRVHQARQQFGTDWWGGNIVESCLSGELVRCWREGPEFSRVLSELNDSDPVFRICRRIAARAVRNALVDPTHGATYYRRPGENPHWLGRHIPTVSIGLRIFYRSNSCSN